MFIDLMVFAFCGFSAVLGGRRGLQLEARNVGGWLLAAVAAVNVWPFAKYVCHLAFGKSLLIDIVSLVGVFLILLVPLTMVTFFWRHYFIRNYEFKLLDTVGGIAFGLLRALLVLSVAVLLLRAIAGTAALTWVGGSYPVVEAFQELFVPTHRDEFR